MLNAPALKKRLVDAMKERPEVKQARIAEATGKTPQAVSAWVKTGQIDPVHFPVLAQLFGKPLEYWHGTDRVSESADVSYLPSQAAGRTDPIIRAARATADKLAARLGIDRASDAYLDILDEIREELKQAFEELPSNRLDLTGKLSPKPPEETTNAAADRDGREDRTNGDEAGGRHRRQAGKASPGRKRR